MHCDGCTSCLKCSTCGREDKYITTTLYNLIIPEFIKGRIRKKLRERSTRELAVSELMAQTGSPCSIDMKIKTRANHKSQ